MRKTSDGPDVVLGDVRTVRNGLRSDNERRVAGGDRREHPVAAASRVTYALARVAAGDEGAWRRRYPADRLRTRPTVYVRGLAHLGSAECAPTGLKHGSSIGSSN